ncbi:helix-turn-helix domain-containing protein [Pseudonocardia sp. NPDC049154]|uniref:helix-turn-helix domain-containing protein n=1 Tax=Pseudonocardia sp. NPDC049154 TaxID=3155501 RepID=UPI0033C90D79
MGCHTVTVGKWLARFVGAGLDGLSDEPRPGAPRTISDEQIEQVVVAPWSAPRPRPRTGRARRWPPRAACRGRPWGGSGRPSGSSPPGGHVQAVDRPAPGRPHRGGEA